VLDRGERSVVGVAAVRQGAVLLTDPEPRLLAAIADALYDASEAVSARQVERSMKA
jgi:hypothetical protein